MVEVRFGATNGWGWLVEDLVLRQIEDMCIHYLCVDCFRVLFDVIGSGVLWCGVEVGGVTVVVEGSLLLESRRWWKLRQCVKGVVRMLRLLSQLR